MNFSLRTFIYISATHSSTKSGYQSSNSAGTDATGGMPGKVFELLGIDRDSEHQQHFKGQHGREIPIWVGTRIPALSKSIVTVKLSILPSNVFVSVASNQKP